jgi:hypothetical protein
LCREQPLGIADAWAVEGPPVIEEGEASVRYRVHRLEVKEKNAQDRLEEFLNRLEGDVVAVIPFTTPSFQGMGATTKVRFLLVIERLV